MNNIDFGIVIFLAITYIPFILLLVGVIFFFIFAFLSIKRKSFQKTPFIISYIFNMLFILYELAFVILLLSGNGLIPN